jgi:hypothetical protein
MNVLYVYALARQPVNPGVEAVDGSNNFGAVTRHGISAIHTPVPEGEFSQEAVDARAGDLEWLGAVGYRHQAVVAAIMKQTDIIPLRAFTLFSSEDAIARYLDETSASLKRKFERIGGKQEWTLRIEFDPQAWNDALVARVEPLRNLVEEMKSASPGKAFLIGKKLDEERKRASREAEQVVVGEIQDTILQKLKSEIVSESREQRGGAFPQINVLVNRDEEGVLQQLHRELNDRYRGEGVTLSLSGPWPAYTFAGLVEHG